MMNQEDIEILEELRSYFGDKALLKNDDESAHIHNALLDAIKIVKASVTPERPKGKWNFIGYQMFECSSCKSAYTQNQFEELRLYTTDDLLPKFCPNCGSHNGGGENA